MNKIFYDFEVFKYDWLVVFIDYDTKEKTVIINNVEELRTFYEKKLIAFSVVIIQEHTTK